MVFGKPSMPDNRGEGFPGFMMRSLLCSGIIVGAFVVGPWCPKASGTTLIVGATTLGVIGPGSTHMMRGELLMAGWGVGEGISMGIMVERGRTPVGGGLLRMTSISFFVERKVAQGVAIGMGVGQVAVFNPGPPADTDFFPALDMHGRVDVLQLGKASLGILLAVRAGDFRNEIAPAVPSLPNVTPRIALIGIGLI